MNSEIKNDFQVCHKCSCCLGGGGGVVADWSKDRGPHYLGIQSKNICITQPLPH